MVVKSKTRRCYRKMNRFVKICFFISLLSVLLIQNNPNVRHRIRLAIQRTETNLNYNQSEYQDIEYRVVF